MIDNYDNRIKEIFKNWIPNKDVVPKKWIDICNSPITYTKETNTNLDKKG